MYVKKLVQYTVHESLPFCHCTLYSDRNKKVYNVYCTMYSVHCSPCYIYTLCSIHDVCMFIYLFQILISNYFNIHDLFIIIINLIYINIMNK